jgi:hypothetical protein
MGWFHRIGWRIGVTALVIVILAARLTWIAWHTETGWETIADDCHAAVIGQFFGYRLPLPVGGLSEQSDFWVREVNRVLAEEPHSPDLLVGALLVLNSPCWNYGALGAPKYFGMPGADLSRVIQPGSGEEMPNSPERRALQHKLIAELMTDFAQSPNVWRTLAMLPGTVAERHKIVKECQSHDPDNALYDYLAAELDFPKNGISHLTEYARQKLSVEVLAELDAETEKSIQSTNAGLDDIGAALSKPTLEFPERRIPILTFLDQAHLPVGDRVWIAANLTDNSRSTQLTQTWMRVSALALETRFEDHARVLPLIKPLALVVLGHGVEQTLPISDERAEWNIVWMLTTDISILLRGAHGDASIQQQNAPVNPRVFEQKYGGAFMTRQKQWAARNRHPSGANRWIDFAPREVIRLATILFLAAGVAYLVSRFVRRRLAGASDSSPVALGALPQVIAWSTALLVTGAIFGLSPGGVISQSVQSYFLSATFLALLTLLPLGVASWWGGRYSLRILMELVFVYAVIFAGFVYWNLTTGAMKKFPPDIAVVPHGAGTFSADRIRQSLNLSEGTIAWSAVQWVLYDGPIWTMALALLAIGWWTLDRAKRVWKESSENDSPAAVRRRWLAWVTSRCVAWAAAGAAVVALAVFLALEPERIAHNEAIYLSDYQRVHDPDAYWGGLKQAQQKLLEEMRADVEQELSRSP